MRLVSGPGYLLRLCNYMLQEGFLPWSMTLKKLGRCCLSDGKSVVRCDSQIQRDRLVKMASPIGYRPMGLTIWTGNKDVASALNVEMAIKTCKVLNTGDKWYGLLDDDNYWIETDTQTFVYCFRLSTARLIRKLAK